MQLKLWNEVEMDVQESTWTLRGPPFTTLNWVQVVSGLCLYVSHVSSVQPPRVKRQGQVSCTKFISSNLPKTTKTKIKRITIRQGRCSGRCSAWPSTRASTKASATATTTLLFIVVPGIQQMSVSYTPSTALFRSLLWDTYVGPVWVTSLPARSRSLLQLSPMWVQHCQDTGHIRTYSATGEAWLGRWRADTAVPSTNLFPKMGSPQPHSGCVNRKRHTW